MTVQSSIMVGSVSFTTTGLEFTYTTQGSTFGLAGSADVDVTGIGNLGVTFGHGSSPGLVISGGELEKLDMTVDGNITVGGAVFQSTGLEFTYVAGMSSSFSLSGKVGIDVGAVDNLVGNLRPGSGAWPRHRRRVAGQSRHDDQLELQGRRRHV